MFDMVKNNNNNKTIKKKKEKKKQGTETGGTHTSQESTEIVKPSKKSMSVNFSCDTTQMTVSMNKTEWICETCYQGQIHSLQ